MASSRSARLLYGGLAGFTTMVANAGGPVTSMYFLACRYPVKAFLGTPAWFFFAVNLIKLPFSIAIGLVNPTTIALAAVSAPVVVAVVWDYERVFVRSVQGEARRPCALRPRTGPLRASLQ